MKPVLIVQHLHGDGPAYLATWLASRGVQFEVCNTEAGHQVPGRIDAYAALAVLGGEMSANDPLPSLRRTEHLILRAIDAGRPVLGHCLGGQLMARALGATVGPSPAPEIGWQTLHVAENPHAQAWLGPPGPRTVFHWHYEAFALPAGAVAVAGNAACPHQAFALGPHLAMQFHVEIDAEKLGRWAACSDEGFLADQQRHATVQSGPDMVHGCSRHLAAHQALADRIYAHWLGRAVRGA